MGMQPALQVLLGMVEYRLDLLVSFWVSGDGEGVQPGQPSFQQGQHIGGIRRAEGLLSASDHIYRRGVGSDMYRPDMPDLQLAYTAGGEPAAPCEPHLG